MRIGFRLNPDFYKDASYRKILQRLKMSGLETVESGSEVFGNTNVALVGMGDTAEEIDGIHTDDSLEERK